ncbi:ABC transporter substrate-binding protein [Bradyrhizobium sp. 61]|uniref:TAXI family TRAP transporter solute-binding subunit n=1 Tax=unclassified Bradyrhizobium TaxID=2631580 RepID=UPI001FF8EA0E|nr:MULTISPECIES: TAXI family TRAP transporter solute-binding subunit [unclassified Bradyrhizobium]MCK1280698.1 ABC transporter substrate-binding protein [Bradyrhizobium sp. 61]MCK1445669.1 ABC transporter substrate-binding protein [Bradyrhizobium sp. 48]
MTGLAIAQWPQWLRSLIVGLVTVAVICVGWLAYRYFAKPVFLTVAAGSADGETLALISAISARLTASKSHVRLKISDSGSSAKAAELLAAGKADLAVVRGDTGGLADARSVLLLTHGVVLIVAPSAVNADGLGDLRDTTIGVIGGPINHPVVGALKQVYQFDRAKVRFQDVAIADGSAALSSGRVQALLAVAPLTEKYLSKIREFFQKPGVKGSSSKLIEIEFAGAVANVAQYYESYDIPKGTLRGAPPIPSDDLTSLRTSFFLVANKSVDADAITDLTQSLVDVRRDLLSQYPILAQAAAPSTDADALIPIHPGAATYYNGDQQSFLDKYDDKLYYASLLLGSLISIIVAAWRFARSGTGPQSMLEPLYEMGNEIKNARSESELEDIEKRIDGILKSEIARNARADAESAEMAALGLAAHRLQYLMSHRRTRIRSAPTAED